MNRRTIGTVLVGALFLVALLLGMLGLRRAVVLERINAQQETVVIDRYKMLVFDDGEILMFDTARGLYRQVRKPKSERNKPTNPDGSIPQRPNTKAPFSI